MGIDNDASGVALRVRTKSLFRPRLFLVMAGPRLSVYC